MEHSLAVTYLNFCYPFSRFLFSSETLNSYTYKTEIRVNELYQPNGLLLHSTGLFKFEVYSLFIHKNRVHIEYVINPI